LIQDKKEYGANDVNRILLYSLILLSFSGVTYALPYSVTDTTRFYSHSTDSTEDLLSNGGAYVNELEYASDWVTWRHQYTFDPAATSITSATLTLSLRDDGGFLDSREFGFGWTEGGAWGYREVDTGDYTLNVGLSGLSDGNYTVTLASSWGDFIIDLSRLIINYEGSETVSGVTGVASVPEPGKILLLGVGLIGLAGFSRKKLLN
jgi:hypothetical protein